MPTLNQFTPVADFQRAKSNALGIRSQEQAIAREKQAAPVRNELNQLGLEIKQRSGQRDKNQDVVDSMRIMHNVATAIASLPENQRAQGFSAIEPKLHQMGISTEGIIQNGFSDETLLQVIRRTEGFIKDPNAINQLSAGQRERGDLKADLKGAFLPNGQLKKPENMTAIQKSAAIGLKLIPGAGNKASLERIGEDPELTTKVATSQARIKSAVKQAEIEAKARGEAVTDLDKRKAALPGIQEVVSKLKSLSDEATFTLAGKAYNEIAKQFGFSTDGDTARTSMVSIVDNQVLPLLKPIFGAAFTAIEGDRLRDAFLNPDSTPDSRKASLDAFLEQTIRNINSLERENELQQGVKTNLGQQDAQSLGASSEPEGATATGPNGQKIITTNGQWVVNNG